MACGCCPHMRRCSPRGAQITSDQLTVEAGEGFGILHDAARGRHTGLVARNNRATPLWIQNARDVEIVGAILESNGFAGVVGVDSSDLRISNTRVAATEERTRIVGILGSRQVGDGVQLVRTSTAVRLSNLTLDANERAGVLFDLGGGTFDPPRCRRSQSAEHPRMASVSSRKTERYLRLGRRCSTRRARRGQRLRIPWRDRYRRYRRPLRSPRPGGVGVDGLAALLR